MLKFVFIFIVILVIVFGVVLVLVQDVDDNGFNGVYIGGLFGYGVQLNDGVIFLILFDCDCNGMFGDIVIIVLGVNVFLFGFCGGVVILLISGICFKDKDGIEYMGCIGVDIQCGKFVIGFVGEIGKIEICDSVLVFSIMFVFYIMM